MASAPSKGEKTRERILERAGQLASRDGLDGLSIGVLAADLGMSKAGLFAHFASKEDMQLQILRAWGTRFRERVGAPAVQAPRGRARLERFLALWLDWLRDPAAPGGCLFIAAAIEVDDQPGPVRDFLADQQRKLQGFIAGLAEAAIAADELRPDLDAEQLAFEIHGVILAAHHGLRLLRDPGALDRAHVAFARLLAENERSSHKTFRKGSKPS